MEIFYKITLYCILAIEYTNRYLIYLIINCLIIHINKHGSFFRKSTILSAYDVDPSNFVFPLVN